MGYTTDFEGRINIEPPLNFEEIEYLNKFNSTRRMSRTNGPYFVDGDGIAGQAHENDILDYNEPPEGQPNLWCQWVPTADGSALEWDGMEKFYNSPQWMQYLIDHFIGDYPQAQMRNPNEFAFLQTHKLSGVVHAYGEERSDIWTLVVHENRVTRKEGIHNLETIQEQFASEPPPVKGRFQL